MVGTRRKYVGGKKSRSLRVDGGAAGRFGERRKIAVNVLQTMGDCEKSVFIIGGRLLFVLYNVSCRITCTARFVVIPSRGQTTWRVSAAAAAGAGAVVCVQHARTGRFQRGLHKRARS